MLRGAAVLPAFGTLTALQEGPGGHSCKAVRGGMSFATWYCQGQVRSVIATGSHGLTGTVSYHSFVNQVCLLPGPH